MSSYSVPDSREAKHEEDVSRFAVHSSMPKQDMVPSLHKPSNMTTVYPDKFIRGEEAARGEDTQFSGVRLPVDNQSAGPMDVDKNGDGRPIEGRGVENSAHIAAKKQTEESKIIQIITNSLAAPLTPKRPIEEGKSESWLRALAAVRHKPQLVDAQTQTVGPFDATTSYFPLSDQIGLPWQNQPVSETNLLPTSLSTLASPGPSAQNPPASISFPEAMKSQFNLSFMAQIQPTTIAPPPPVRRPRGRPPGSKNSKNLPPLQTAWLANGDMVVMNLMAPQNGSTEPGMVGKSIVDSTGFTAARTEAEEALGKGADASSTPPGDHTSVNEASVSMSMPFPSGPDGSLQPMDPAAFAAMLAGLGAPIKMPMPQEQQAGEGPGDSDGAGAGLASFPLSPGFFGSPMDHIMAGSVVGLPGLRGKLDARGSEGFNLSPPPPVNDREVLGGLGGQGGAMGSGVKKQKTVSGGPDLAFLLNINLGEANKVVSNGTCPNIGLPEGMQVSKRMLAATFHLPIDEAADSLKIGVTVLKKLCRSQFDVPRWPYRKLFSLDHLIETVRNDVLENPGYGETAVALLGTLEDCRQKIYENPSFEIPLEIKKLRQANFKNEYKQRQKEDGVEPKAVGRPKDGKTPSKKTAGRPRKRGLMVSQEKKEEEDSDMENLSEAMEDSEKD